MKQKIFSLKETTKILSKLKKRKKKIVLCHGVFDLLHIGHIKHFEQSKSFGDILIVSITKDQFINKGPNRPAFNEQLRSKTLASLSIVDYVVLAPSNTATEVITFLKPDIYLLNDKKNYFFATIEFSKISQNKLSVKPYFNNFSPFQIDANLLNISGLILWQCSKIFSK